MQSDVQDKYTRVLVISADALNDNSATGMTMTNLFKGWPLGSIAQVYWDLSSPNPYICANSWRIYHKNNAPLVHASKQLFHSFKRVGHTLLFGRKFSNRSATGSQENVLRTLSPSIATAWADIIPIRLSEEFWRWLADFNPEAIYSVLGNIRIMNIVLQVSNRLSVPIVPHFMDDWPSTVYRHGFTHRVPRSILLKEIEMVLRISRRRIAISEAMAKEYETRYGRHFDTFMNCVTIAASPETFLREHGGPITFGYVGGLHLNRWQSLQSVADALSHMKNDGHGVELVVFAPLTDIERYGHLLSENPVVRIGGTLSPNEIKTTLRQYDVLVHIESFDEKDRQYTRLSISTKIPQYMASGRPILAYGPSDVASCRYIEERGCGLVVGSKNVESLSQAVNSLVKDADLRNRLGKRAYETAIQKHNDIVEREKFRRLLSDSRYHEK